MSVPTVFSAFNQERCYLKELTDEFPNFSLEGPFVQAAYVNAVRERATSNGGLARLCAAARNNLSTRRTSAGYLLLDQLLPDPADESKFLLAATIVSSLFGRPFHMVRRFAVWETLGVDYEKEPFRGGGIGHQPLHIDGVNTMHPPDFLVLLCRRQDPAGGGANLISNLQSAVDELEESDRVYLQRSIYQEGEFYDIEGVGAEYRPFPVLTRRADAMWQVRVTGKMLPGMRPSRSKRVLERLIALLENKQEVIRLESGQALVVNQILNAHGRFALGQGQTALHSSEQRDCRQGFLRSEQSSLIEASPVIGKNGRGLTLTSG